MTEQLGLLFDEPLSRVEREFRQWINTPDGTLCLQEATERALLLKRRGFKHYGIGAIWESMRFDYSVRVGPDEEDYKLNNNHRSHLAREIVKRTPELRGFFEMRTLTGQHR